jgi:Holliday junction resolvase-like predicted endonuclease
MFVTATEPASPHRRQRAVNRRVQGDIGEASAIEWLTSKGALVWVPMGHSPDVDLIAETEHRLLRVQVKTSTLSKRLPGGDVRWTVSIATYGGNRSWSGVTKRFDPLRIDYLFALVGDGRRWFVPASCVEARRAVALGGISETR